MIKACQPASAARDICKQYFHIIKALCNMQAFLSDPTLTRTPKQSLLEFFQIRGSIPQFKVQQVQKLHTLDHLPTFTCHLTIAQLPSGPDGREASTRFTAEASTKKQAEQFAAERALDHIRSRGFLVPPFVSAVPLTGNQQQPPHQSGHSNLGQLPPSLRRMPEAAASANAAHAAGSLSPDIRPPADGAVTAGAPPPEALQQPGDDVDPAVAPAAARSSALNGGRRDASKGLDELKPEEVKQLLVEAQQRVRSLEMQLGRYSDWHRRMRELALEEVA